MYSAQTTVSRVQSEIKKKKFTQKMVLTECGLNENTLKQMTDKTGMASFNLAKIADYLDCSVDYLLGRTENPEAHKNGNNVSVGNVSGNSGAIGVGNTVTNTNVPLDEQTLEMLNTYQKLSPLNKAKLLVYADELNK